MSRDSRLWESPLTCIISLNIHFFPGFKKLGRGAFYSFQRIFLMVRSSTVWETRFLPQGCVSTQRSPRSRKNSAVFGLKRCFLFPAKRSGTPIEPRFLAQKDGHARGRGKVGYIRVEWRFLIKTALAAPATTRGKARTCFSVLRKLFIFCSHVLRTRLFIYSRPHFL